MSCVFLNRVLRSTSLAVLAASVLSACGALGNEPSMTGFLAPDSNSDTGNSIPPAAEASNFSQPVTAGFSTQETVVRQSGFPEFTVDPAGTVGRYQVGPSYSLNGRVVTPTEDLRYSEVGLAGWYGDGFEGATTANGERLNSSLRTLAHRTLPFGTVVKITSLDTGRSVIARVNDRGPIQTERMIDVTTRIRDELAFNNAGQLRVQIHVLEDETRHVAQLTGGNVGGEKRGVSIEDLRLVEGGGMRIDSAPLSPASSSRSIVESWNTPAIEAPRPIPTSNSVDTSSSGELPTGVYVHVGSFTNKNNALNTQKSLSWLGQIRMASINVDGTEFWRVVVGPYASESEARVVLGRAVASGATDAMVRRF